MTDTLRELAAKALADKIAAVEPGSDEQKRWDPDAWRQQEEERERQDRDHRWAMFRQSPLYGWFPDVHWGLGAYPMYPRWSIVVYDTEELRTEDTPYLMIRWDADDQNIRVLTTTRGVDTDTGYEYWSEGAELRSPADVGKWIADVDKWVAARRSKA